MTLHQRGDRGQVDLVMFADRLGGQGHGQGRAAPGALVRIVIDDMIEILAQSPAMAFMTGLGAARAGLVALRLAIRRRQLGRRSRRLGRLLKTKHQLDQLGLAQTLKIVPAHAILNQRSRRAARR